MRSELKTRCPHCGVLVNLNLTRLKRKGNKCPNTLCGRKLPDDFLHEVEMVLKPIQVENALDGKYSKYSR